MKQKISLAELNITILGLGLMGGSLALALRGQVKSITGVDHDPTTLNTALKREVIDHGSSSLTHILNSPDILILAVPVKVIIRLIRDLPEFVSDRTLIMDLGSTKCAVMKAFADLPTSYQVIGGHPMCGKSSGGLTHAEASLYRNAPFALIKSKNASIESQSLAEALVQVVGAKALWIEAQAHDEITAGVSHLPYLLSCALVDATPLPYASLIGPGYRSTTRLADTPGRMMNDILETNQNNIVSKLDSCINKITTIRNLIANGQFTVLFDTLNQIAVKHNELLTEDAIEVPDEN